VSLPRHPAWIEIDLAALTHNARVLCQAIPIDARLGLLVKANGYGHGLEPAARAGIAGGAEQLGVANLDEGLAVRRAGIQAPTMIVYPIPPDGIDAAVDADLELTVSGLDAGRRILESWAASDPRGTDRPLMLHVEIDTGMGRGGVAPASLLEVVKRIDATPSTRIAGFWSHLADGSDVERSRQQTERFDAAVALVAATGRAVPARHLATTDAIFTRTAPSYEMVRVGLGYYGELGLGVEPLPELAGLATDLRPAMTVKARPIRVEALPAGATVGYGGEWRAERPSIIVTLPIGYADGWMRSSWPGASALLRGRRVTLVGRVSMDSVCADVTDVAAEGDVTLDDEFVLLGAQGDARITTGELARIRRTIPNEVFTAFGPRLPRVYLGESATAAAAVSQGSEALERNA
jgi:alanine racemase